MKPVFLIGYMGAGKTTIGRIVADYFGWRFIDLDHYIEKKYAKKITEIFQEKGESGFREIERNSIKEVADFQNVVISTGGGTPCFFNNMEIMNEKGYTFFLDVSLERLYLHLKESCSKRPLLANKTDKELKEFIEKGRIDRVEYYEQATFVIPNPSLSGEEIIHKIEGNLFSIDK